MGMTLQKRIAALVSVISNTTLIALKITAGIVSQSMSIISEAVHSFGDLLASIMALFAVTQSSKPADDDHPFGHGKYEDLSGMIEGILILFISFYILYEATRKIIFGSYTVLDTNLAIYVMVFSVFVNIVVSAYLFHIAKKSSSIAIYADAEHLRADVLSSAAVLIGLIMIKITNLHILDPIFAIFIAVWILHSGWKICKKTFTTLVDTSLPDEEIEEIKNIVDSLKSECTIECKSLRTRRSGITKIVDIILAMDGNCTIEESHRICDKIEQLITTKLGAASITIHVEPIE